MVRLPGDGDRPRAGTDRTDPRQCWAGAPVPTLLRPLSYLWRSSSEVPNCLESLRITRLLRTRNQNGALPIKISIESDWEALLAEMRKARECGVPGIVPREIVEVEQRLETIRHNMQAGARMLVDSLVRGKSSTNLDALDAYFKVQKKRSA